MENKTTNIFLVDDDNMFTTMLSDHLRENERFHVTVFTTGEACLEKLDEKPDVIILDYYLDSDVPGAKNGLDILKMIRKHSPEQRVIMLSAQEHYGVALQTIASGAVQYVIKDVSSFAEIDRILQEF